MASNQTTNYGLNQWEATDQVLRTEFNADNAKIDAALKGLADKDMALEAMVSAAAEAAGNCEMEYFTYYGNGDYGDGNETEVTFSVRPEVYIIAGFRHILVGMGGRSYAALANGANGDEAEVSWSGSKLSILSYRADYQMNQSGSTYLVLGLKRKQ